MSRILPVLSSKKVVGKTFGKTAQFKNVILPALVLVYLLSPIDFIPDWIPVIGVFDDLALLALAIPMLVTEAEKFVAWEVSQKAGDQIVEAEIVK